MTLRVKLKKLFRETNDLKQKRKYLNVLIYIEYLKKLDNNFDSINGFVNNSSFNKEAYKQIKKINNIPLHIFTSTNLADDELNEVIISQAKSLY